MTDDPQERVAALDQLVSAWQNRASAEERLTTAFAEARKFDITPSEVRRWIVAKTEMTDPEADFAMYEEVKERLLLNGETR